MRESFAEMLGAGGKSNSLGRASEVVAIVSQDKSRLEELYDCIALPDAWIRMRAVDSLEKVCREHPEWIVSYVDRFNNELALSDQASIQWHLAEMYAELELTPSQKKFAVEWLIERLSSTDVDWIVAANSMTTLVQFAEDGSITKERVATLLKIQLRHKSNAVIKRATKMLDQLSK